MAIKNTGVSEVLVGAKTGDAPPMFAAAHAALPSRALRAKVRRASGALMSFPAILLPLFVQVFLTFALLSWMAVARGRALRGGEVRPTDIALRQRAWPARAEQVGNAFANQLELPLLFYVLVILALVTRKADFLFVVMSWMFVATRLVHAFVHTGSNVVRIRGGVFAVGAIILIVMWIIFAARILFAGMPG
jgi:hypothetical protein